MPGGFPLQEQGPGMAEMFNDLAVEREEKREGDRHMAKVATDEWFAAHDAYHKASDAYNQRLTLVKAERERGNWTMTTDIEHQALGLAQSKALAADNDLYIALRAVICG